MLNVLPYKCMVTNARMDIIKKFRIFLQSLTKRNEILYEQDSLSIIVEFAPYSRMPKVNYHSIGGMKFKSILEHTVATIENSTYRRLANSEISLQLNLEPDGQLSIIETPFRPHFSKTLSHNFEQ